jgi:hypothetical protein
MLSSMKLSPQNHRALETDLITSHRTRLGPKNIHKVGRDWGIKGHESGRCSSQPQDMYKAALKSGIRWWWYWIRWQGKFVGSRMITLLFSLYGLPITSMCLGQDHIFIQLGPSHPTPPSLSGHPTRTCVGTPPRWEPMWQYPVIVHDCHTTHINCHGMRLAPTWHPHYPSHLKWTWVHIKYHTNVVW